MSWWATPGAGPGCLPCHNHGRPSFPGPVTIASRCTAFEDPSVTKGDRSVVLHLLVLCQPPPEGGRGGANQTAGPKTRPLLAPNLPWNPSVDGLSFRKTFSLPPIQKSMQLSFDGRLAVSINSTFPVFCSV
ncbi:hypothetical protein BDV27DRAFT_146445 [Aspergillus caelatus]|uniref:Uncharacterized protein n=2 Tax=Aspergillus subgen. Circumdati TaxID=2720871 RepID=A0A5N7A1H4_9EURO|nr:uncharacterized protein BDV27DRAFT_146445 [Aspergillus caelatus]KAE8363059.1 hypothetical protein BDV27DRAFT_146445 [Aspergillus caelatus]KAE8414110.1 hypothetical protein BDV36DRAFT_286444 [Aspergillus pseudocaelatus]